MPQRPRQGGRDSPGHCLLRRHYFYCVAVCVLSWFCDVVVFCHFQFCSHLDWLQSLKQFFINVSYHILVASLTLMALEPSELDWLQVYNMTLIKIVLRTRASLLVILLIGGNVCFTIAIFMLL